MAEQPVGAEGTAPLGNEHAAGNGVAAAGDQPPTSYPPFSPLGWRQERPKVVLKADLLPAVSVLSTVALLGLLVGWIWSRLAQAQRMVIDRDGSPVPLTAESFHRADDLILFTLLGLGAGLVTGLGVWFLRERRGPVIMLAAVLGSVVAGWLAMQVGVAWAEGRYPADSNVKVLDIVFRAPQLESAWVLLAWPLTTALVYGVAATLNGMDDLGRRLG